MPPRKAASGGTKRKAASEAADGPSKKKAKKDGYPIKKAAQKAKASTTPPLDPEIKLLNVCLYLLKITKHCNKKKAEREAHAQTEQESDTSNSIQEHEQVVDKDEATRPGAASLATAAVASRPQETPEPSALEQFVSPRSEPTETWNFDDSGFYEGGDEDPPGEWASHAWDDGEPFARSPGFSSGSTSMSSSSRSVPARPTLPQRGGPSAASRSVGAAIPSRAVPSFPVPAAVSRSMSGSFSSGSAPSMSGLRLAKSTSLPATTAVASRRQETLEPSALEQFVSPRSEPTETWNFDDSGFYEGGDEDPSGEWASHAWDDGEPFARSPGFSSESTSMSSSSRSVPARPTLPQRGGPSAAPRSVGVATPSQAIPSFPVPAAVPRSTSGSFSSGSAPSMSGLRLAKSTSLPAALPRLSASALIVPARAPPGSSKSSDITILSASPALRRGTPVFATPSVLPANGARGTSKFRPATATPASSSKSASTLAAPVAGNKALPLARSKFRPAGSTAASAPSGSRPGLMGPPSVPARMPQPTGLPTASNSAARDSSAVGRGFQRPPVSVVPGASRANPAHAGTKSKPNSFRPAFTGIPRDR